MNTENDLHFNFLSPLHVENCNTLPSFQLYLSIILLSITATNYPCYCGSVARYGPQSVASATWLRDERMLNDHEIHRYLAIKISNSIGEISQKRRKRRQQRVRFANEPLDAGRHGLADAVETPAASVHVQRGAFGTSGDGVAENAEETIVQLPRAAGVRPAWLRFTEELVERGGRRRAEEARRQTGRRDPVTTAVHVPIFRRIVQEAAAAAVQRDRDRFQRHYETNLGEEPRGGVSREEQQRQNVGAEQELRAELCCYVEGR